MLGQNFVQRAGLEESAFILEPGQEKD